MIEYYIYAHLWYNIITHPSWFADIPGVTSCKEICSAPVCLRGHSWRQGPARARACDWAWWFIAAFSDWSNEDGGKQPTSANHSIGIHILCMHTHTHIYIYLWILASIYIYTVKMKVRMPPRIPNIPPPQLECGPRTAKNPSVRMPPHPGFKFCCFWRTLCTNPSLRMPPHYEYHQMLECS